MAEEFTLADLTRIVGAKRRTVQLWAEAGVIQADPSTERAGTGVARRFTRAEAVIACLIHAFAIRQVSVGELLKLSRGLRDRLQKPEVMKSVEAALKRSVDAAYLVIVESEGEIQNVCLFPYEKGRSEDETIWSSVGQSATPDVISESSDGMAFVVDMKAYLRNLA